MNAIPKIFIMLALWLLYTFLVWRGCSEELCTGCETQPTTEVPPTDTGTVTAKRYPIDFKWSDPTAFTNDGYDALKKSILAKGGNDNILQITGLYFEGESKPAGYENMGFSRADKVKALFAGSLPNNRIRTRARVVDEREGVRTDYFESVEFEWIAPNQSATKTVEEIADRTIIRFPTGSVEKEYDAAVDEYLDKLAQRVKQTNERITLTGHTDNTGNPATNLDLGRRRANAIRAILIKKGVKSELITVDSKGQTQPTDTNDTPDGRHNNRRVEVRLIKQQ